MRQAAALLCYQQQAPRYPHESICGVDLGSGAAYDMAHDVSELCLLDTTKTGGFISKYLKC